MRREAAVRWLRLGAGLTVLALVIAAIHVGVGHVGGPFGRMWSANVASGVNANAFFYTEVGEVREFLDEDRGRYAAPRGSKNDLP